MPTDVPRQTMSGDGRKAPGGVSRPSPEPGGWTVGRVIAIVIGSVLALVSLGLLGGGGTLLWADQALRTGGYVTTGTATYSTAGYALASQDVSLGWGWMLTGLVGDVRLQVSAVGQGRPVFVAIGPADRVAAYLSGSDYTTVSGTGTADVASHYGTAAPALPRSAGIWVAQTTGTGTQTLRWTAHEGDWMAVAMNPDGSAGVTVRADAGVLAPGLLRLAVEAIIGGAIAALLSAALIIVPVRLAAGTR